MNALKDYDVDVLNESGETIPGFAVLQVSGYEVDRNGREYVKVTQPDGEGNIFLLNSPFPIEDDKIGKATGNGFVYALFDDADTPAVDEQWGPETGSWALKKDNPGFYIVGDDKGSGANARVRVQPAASSGGGGASFALITSSVSACSWDDITFTLTPATVSVLLIGSDGTLAEEPIDVENGLPDSATVDTDKARIGIVVGGKLVNVSCLQVNYAPEEDP